MVAQCEYPINSRPLPLVGSPGGYPIGMGTVREHRREWFDHFLSGMERIQRRGAKRRLAEKVGTAPSVISQIAAGERQVGDELARRFEQKHGMARGQMDGPLNPRAVDQPRQPEIDVGFLEYLISELEEGLDDAAQQLPAKVKAEVIAEMYSGYVGTGERPSRAVILKFAQRATR